MYWKFGVQGKGTYFRPIGLINAETGEIAVKKMNEWASTKTDEELISYLFPYMIDENVKRPDVCLDYECNNTILLVID